MHLLIGGDYLSLSCCCWVVGFIAMLIPLEIFQAFQGVSTATACIMVVLR